MKKSFIFIVLFCFLFLLFSFSPEKRDNKEKGSFLGISLEGIRVSQKMLNKNEEETGFFPSFVNLFLQWPRDPSNGYFPQMAADAVWDYGAVMVLTWEPMYIDYGEAKIIPYEEIISGRYDPYLSYMAKELKKFAKPIIIRFAHEMNLSVYHWCVDEKDYNDSYPEIYKNIYNYIYTFFRFQGVGNVIWAFCPNSDSVPPENWNKIENYYPGNDKVDILGTDGYDFGNKKMGEYQSHFRSFKEIFSSSFDELKKLNIDKPFFIFETATAEAGEKKIKWISDALKEIQEKNILSLIWFQIDKEENWKITERDNLEFKKFKQKKGPQNWAWEIINEKIKSFKDT